MAEKAIEDNYPDELVTVLTDTVEGQIRERFEHVVRLKREAAGKGVAEMREYGDELKS